MKSVEKLSKTTFCGRRFTRRQLAQVKETVARFKNLSRNELATTLCEHLDWKTPKGTYKIPSCLKLLEKLETLDIIQLPAKWHSRSTAKEVQPAEKDPADVPVNNTVTAIAPITLQRVVSKADRARWKSYLQSFHYLGFKQPFGCHIGYFIVSQSLQQKLGCLLFTASAAWTLAPRDQWIGWDDKQRRKFLHLIIANNRFLIFPWVKVQNLATKVLSLVTRQIDDDWVHVHGYRPVLMETFVDTTRYSGTCYRAAGWHWLGRTKGRGRFAPDNRARKTIKDIFVYPLQKDWKTSLTQGPSNTRLKKRYRNDLQASRTRSVGDAFVAMWKKVVHILHDVAIQYDEKWRVRQRVIDSLMLMLLIFRLVSSKNAQSYGTTIDDLWDSCANLHLPLPQPQSIAPSSFCIARKKLDENIFKCVNRKILETYVPESSVDTWLGHRLFAVDGSKINLPRALVNYGYKLPSDHSHYPQGLLSCLYQLKSQLPYDFDLVAHNNERVCAEQHLHVLKKNDVVVYDRGYLSYVLLHRHWKTGIHAVFRLQKSSFTVIRKFFTSSQTDALVTIYPSASTQVDIRREYPDLEIIPLKMRLIKYQINETVYCLGTTLVDPEQHYPVQEFMDVYHSRWGIEELYKVSKRIFIIEDFHSKYERGVKQEIFAHFVLITMNRLFANRADSELNPADRATEPMPSQRFPKPGDAAKSVHRIKTNFKNCIHVFSRHLEELLCLHTRIKTVVQSAFLAISGRYHRIRLGRAFARKSMRPQSKWRATAKKKRRQKLTTTVAPV